MKYIQNLTNAILHVIPRLFRQLGTIVTRFPIASFLVLLTLLFGVIALGSILRKPKPAENSTAPAKQVIIYAVGGEVSTQVVGKVQKSGVIKVVALAPGIVSHLSVQEGQSVGQGTPLVSLGSNYAGSNASSIQRQLAQAQLANVQQTFDAQKEAIDRQRDIANQTLTNTEQLRTITVQSLEDTRSLINNTQAQMNTNGNTITTLQQNNPNGVNNTTIQQAQAAGLQLQASLAQLQANLRNTEYQAVGENPPGRIAYDQKVTALKQLDVQEQSLKLALQSAQFQVRLAQANEAVMYPSAPFAGTIERIYVSVGQSVSPGTPLVTLAGHDQVATIVIQVPQAIATQVSLVTPSTVVINNNTYQLIPTSVSSQATDGDLYAIIFSVPDAAKTQVNDGQAVTFTLALSSKDSQQALFVPLDAIYQSQSQSSVFVAENGRAKAKQIQLGPVTGDFVQVVGGLSANDQIILDRTVVDGDSVTATQNATPSATNQ